MSLVNYQSAYPWTQSIREEVMGLRMPPWQAEDGFGDFKNGHVLPAHEMDMILEWSAGGYPQGPRDQAPAALELEDDWTLGEPTTVLQIAEAYELDAATSEAVRYFVIPAGLDDETTLLGVDFRPGARAVVRGAAVFLDDSGVARELDAADDGPGFAESADDGFPATPPVAVFTPGQPPVLNGGVGYAVSAGTDVVVRIHYKKSWITEGSAFTDQSQVGLHLHDDAQAIATTVVASPGEASGREMVFAHEIAEDATILALFPEVDIDATELIVEAVRPDDTRVPMLWLREPDNGWPTRFWFDEPIMLGAGSRIEVTTLLEPAAERREGTALLGGESGAPVRFALDYVAGTLAAND